MPTSFSLRFSLPFSWLPWFSILPSIVDGNKQRCFVALVECIESLKNDVKKKVRPIFTLRVRLPGPRLAGRPSRWRPYLLHCAQHAPHPHGYTLKSFPQICEDAQGQPAEDI